MHAVRLFAVSLFLSVFLLSTLMAQAASDQGSAPGEAATNGRDRGVMNKFYAVTLMTAFSPVSTRKLAKEYPDYVIYQKKSVVFGKELYLVRLGFFSSFATATVMKDRLIARFPGAWPTEVPETEQASALGIGVVTPSGVARDTGARTAAGAGSTGKKVTAGKAVGTGIFVINLDSGRIAEKLRRTAMPEELNAYRAYVLSETTKGQKLYHYRLGFFPTRADAEQARSFLTRTYPGSSIVEVSREEQALAATPTTSVAGKQGAPSGEGVASSVPFAVAGGEVPNTEIENQAGTLLSEGREHITAGDYIPAIKSLNRLLTLPHNKFTNDAIEYIGVARERGGQFDLAREMYNTYLRVSQDTEGTQRVRQRLASMAGASELPTTTLRAPQDKGTPVKTISGTLSQTFFRGKAETGGSSLFPTDPTLGTNTQHLLISNLDLTARYQGSNYDNRVVLRNQYTYNWLDTTLKDNRLSAAYLELKDKKRDYSTRFGRQPGNTGGVLGIFDGASATYNLTPTWHLTGSTGVPKETKVDAQRYFYSVGTDFGPLAQRWYGGFYYMYQFVEGVEDRNAVGAEVRYFEPRHSVYTLFDYDLGFHVLNIAVLQANWQTEGNTSYNLLLDHRKSPALQTTNVLNGASVLSNPLDPMSVSIVPSYSELSRRYTTEELRDMAKMHTPESNYFDLSVSHPVSPKLQLGGGINMYSISDAAATAVALSQPGTGNTFVYSLRGIGTSLLFDKDISVLTLSHTNGDTSNGNGIALTNKSIFQDKWTVDLGLRLSKLTVSTRDVLTDQLTETENTLVAPLVRFGYRMKQTAVFEIEYGQDRTHSKDTIGVDAGGETIFRTKYYSVGYRWTF